MAWVSESLAIALVVLVAAAATAEIRDEIKLDHLLADARALRVAAENEANRPDAIAAGCKRAYGHWGGHDERECVRKLMSRWADSVERARLDHIYSGRQLAPR